ncbi:hypothetical protein [Yinghuangia seranimata]|uniref:hypothetical protein n=1 Tax=Yinghuangia seranimata TaxID=408067 RepID=UPI00248AA646|nr:hypothetical protein [Yinghuangia seranimata]MDI2130540.1 hypothetical protein [Yinghuangia seranimata]
MAWSEKHGRTWRVRYPAGDGTLASESGFADRDAAEERVTQLNTQPAHDATAPGGATPSTVGPSNGIPAPPTPPDAPPTAERVDAPAEHTPAPVPPAGESADEAAPTGTLFGDWVAVWRTTLDIGEETRGMYESLLRNHLLPRWGELELAGITRSAVRAWKISLDARYAPATVAHIGKLLSMILTDAVDEGLIGANPASTRRRGRRPRVRRPGPVWAEPGTSSPSPNGSGSWPGPTRT